jgi:hypothetical protein
MQKQGLFALVAGCFAAACGAVIAAGLGNYLSFISAVYLFAGAAHSGKGPSDQEIWSFVQVVTIVGAGFGFVFGGGAGALLGRLLAWLGRSGKDRLPARARDRRGPQYSALRMWLLGGAFAVVLLLPTALSLDWLLHVFRQKAAPASAPPDPRPTVDDPSRGPEKGRR